MRTIILVLFCFFLIAIMNVLLKRENKQIKREHYIFGYLFILYLMINLILIVGTSSLSELRFCAGLHKSVPNFENVNFVPLKDSFDITGICNIVLFMPFGFLLPTLWEKYSKLSVTFVYGMIVSILIETSQLFTMNRTCDINDIIFNTTGTVCGWILFKWISGYFGNLVSKTIVKKHEQINIVSKLEPYLYVLTAFIISFFQ